MARTRFPIVYDLLTLEVRRIYQPESDDELPQIIDRCAGPGEGMTFMPSVGADHPYIRAMAVMERMRRAVYG